MPTAPSEALDAWISALTKLHTATTAAWEKAEEFFSEDDDATERVTDELDTAMTSIEDALGYLKCANGEHTFTKWSPVCSYCTEAKP